jgi:transketolase
MKPMSASDYAGRFVHYGIREHGMAAAMNGMALHGGVIPYSGTFLVFSDYARPAIRLAALMGIRVIHVGTHDGIGLGEDGPTHQPIEHLASLRAMPNLNVVRPAGANETALAWRFAIEQIETPTALALSRQGLPTWNPAGVPRDAIHRGAYTLRDSYNPLPDVILIGTGSEVHICNRAADLLEAEGLGTRVVSAPCLDRFAVQDQEYRDMVLPPACRARLAVEAAATMGWHRWVGDDGDVMGMEGFGASGPQRQVYEHFGFTPEHVATRARAVAARVTTSTPGG